MSFPFEFFTTTPIKSHLTNPYLIHINKIASVNVGCVSTMTDDGVATGACAVDLTLVCIVQVIYSSSLFSLSWWRTIISWTVLSLHLGGKCIVHELRGLCTLKSIFI